MSNLSQRAYIHIQQSILSGTLPAGSVISEAGVARALGVSRTPVGEAIRQLAQDGLVRQVPRYGTIVRAPSRGELVEQYEMREALESYAAAQAAARITSAALGRLDGYCDVMSRIRDEIRDAGLDELDAGMLGRFLAADLAFHMLVIETAGNRRMLNVVKDMRTISSIFRTRRMRHDQGIVERANVSHREIVSALRGGDPEAARRLMGKHISESKHQTLAQMDVAPQHEIGTPLAELPDDLVADLNLIEQGGYIAA